MALYGPDMTTPDAVELVQLITQAKYNIEPEAAAEVVTKLAAAQYVWEVCDGQQRPAKIQKREGSCIHPGLANFVLKVGMRGKGEGGRGAGEEGWGVASDSGESECMNEDTDTRWGDRDQGRGRF